MTVRAELTLGVLANEPHASDFATDELLATRGDAASFALLYERYLPYVYRYVAGRLASREEAEDVSGEAFRRAWSSRTSYRGRGSFRAWIFGIVRRTLADHYRSHQPAAHLQPVVAENLLDHQPTPEDHAMQDERERVGHLLLAALSHEQQEILCMRFIAELTYGEIASVVGKREAAVKKIAYRALESLRRRQVYV
jgi:RNA polymerase sigma-70 factor (ECF subfamily)